MLQLTASGRDHDVSRSRDVGQSISLTSGQLVTQPQVRAKIVAELMTSERAYVKLLHDIIEVMHMAGMCLGVIY